MHQFYHCCLGFQLFLLLRWWLFRMLVISPIWSNQKPSLEVVRSFLATF